MGLPTALAFSKKGFNVIGLDIENKKIDLINKEICPINKKKTKEIHNYLPGDIFKSIPKMSHLIDEFHFKPKYTFLEGLKETYWFKDNQNYFE